MTRFKGIATWFTAMAISAFVIQPAPAQVADYPNRPVSVMVGFGPGSGTDILARIVAEELRAELGQPFLVVNRPGATAAIAAEAVANAAPDGYTLFITSNSSHSVNPHIYKTLRYDPNKDFTPIGRLADFPFVLVVNPQLPVRTPHELVQHMRANADTSSYAYGNTPGQVAGASLVKLTNLDAVAVPYKSSPPAIADVAAGLVPWMVVDLASSQAFVGSGRLRAIAVTTSTRSALAPELPTIVETLGLQGYDLRAWTGMFGPAGMPPTITQKLSDALIRILNKPDVRVRLLRGNMEPTPGKAADFKTFLGEQYGVWGKKIREAGIVAE
ncbi:Bug family tripartite tricarboxylate transporter substrate binding protein [Hydrogenophaga sp. BPS33]|uniref:Bug family tripartite tricarboxylate transporter substrate binding protein n=1 Tax=Hydrogenophaga sp. BPS33 TaxID=2651974 RepID=UPI00131F970C|nr:tripartite tricarboxylate transporter substrate-binding protein [Hydrogenophaga sp. BPS33]QHE87511.1 tripartite tricarboxylate transporter substrate binding protein [Hydrogenophaga sp. BPS33]